MQLYDIKARRHDESYDAVSELSLQAGAVFRQFAGDFGWKVSALIRGFEETEEQDDGRPARTILHAELSSHETGYISIDFVRYEDNHLGVDNKVVLRAFSSSGELASSVLRGLKLVSLKRPQRIAILRSELERLADLMEFA